MHIEKKMVEWRQYLHQNPEIEFSGNLTSDFIAKKLDEFGIEVHRNIGKTGLVGVLKCGSNDRSIGLRADFDAIPVQEENVFEYRSQNAGMMHGCGHDGHTSMLLGAAYELSRSRDFDGTVYFIFQPAEEQGTGAPAMIADGLFTRWQIDSVYAMHNLPGLPLGHVETSPSSVMAAENHFKIEIKAAGGHAAMPHLGSDPIPVGAAIVTALQTIITRELSSIGEPAVLSVTNFETNGGANVIPTRVTLSGDMRCFTDEAQAKLQTTMERVIAGQCQSAGLEYCFEFSNCVLSTVNSEQEAAVAVRIAEKIVGAENVNGQCSPYCISEDFSFMQREAPSCYLLIGNGAKGHKGGVALHMPTYDFNDDLLPIGLKFWTALVKDQLASQTCFV
ncbi:hippurate hydrolase [Pseudovibrio ascidiaceicola]|uniref:Hippurate hydrolase n=1 Tax=Pseudovibrio ascidiaceicola TaxID=285279 RepID=A0A1I4FLN3_9HYPH|nr:amidohydrolase [Pseudovibrio ascidiaceicola]SFL18842.1 hippurate hydrolase [Pseudovibrio ascidiaceicola]